MHRSRALNDDGDATRRRTYLNSRDSGNAIEADDVDWRAASCTDAAVGPDPRLHACSRQKGEANCQSQTVVRLSQQEVLQ